MLDTNPSSPRSIGAASPNLLVQTRFHASGNQPPQGVPDTFVVPAGASSLSIGHLALSGNDTDPDPGDSVRVCNYLDQTQHGIVDVHVAGANYLPDADFWTAGQDEFRHVANDRSDCSGHNVGFKVTLIADSTGDPVFADSFDSGDASAWTAEVTGGSGHATVHAKAAFVAPARAGPCRRTGRPTRPERHAAFRRSSG